VEHLTNALMLDAAGRLRVLDRRSDLIISGGTNVYPAEVEAALLEHPAIEEVGVAGVAVGIALGTYRIVTGTPLHYYIMAGYLIVIIQTVFSPRTIVPLAYDSGGVTTSTVTVPVVAALGLGLASAVPGRNPLLDGFGLIAFASVFPIISVLAYAQLSALRNRNREST